MLNLAQLPGVPFHGEFYHATDASGLSEEASRFALYKAGSVSAHTLLSSEYVIITDVAILATLNGVLIQVYDGANAAVGAGEQVAAFMFGTGAGVQGASPEVFRVPHFCQVGTYPKLIAASDGPVRAYIRGVISDRI